MHAKYMFDQTNLNVYLCILYKIILGYSKTLNAVEDQGASCYNFRNKTEVSLYKQELRI